MRITYITDIADAYIIDIANITDIINIADVTDIIAVSASLRHVHIAPKLDIFWFKPVLVFSFSQA